jgi:hypothetical protein
MSGEPDTILAEFERTAVESVRLRSAIDLTEGLPLEQPPQQHEEATEHAGMYK